MAGILNNKTRMLDTILTREGRRQIASGDLKIKYVTFTDRHTFYSQDDDDAADDADDRIFLESFHRSQDQIIFETDGDGRLLPFNGADVKILNGKLHKISSGKHQEITGSSTIDAIYELLESSTNNFVDQQIIGTKETFSDTNGFEIHPKSVKFVVTNDQPFGRNEISEIEIEKVESLHQDKRLQHLPFFKYLPPVNKPKAGFINGEPLGYYARINQDAHMSYQSILNELISKKSQCAVIHYPDTSFENNIVLQILESTPGNVEKLALIDYGEFNVETSGGSSVHVYFAGKIFEDGNGMQTFVNMFTIIFE